MMMTFAVTYTAHGTIEVAVSDEDVEAMEDSDDLPDAVSDAVEDAIRRGVSDVQLDWVSHVEPLA